MRKGKCLILFNAKERKENKMGKEIKRGVRALSNEERKVQTHFLTQVLKH